MLPQVPTHVVGVAVSGSPESQRELVNWHEALEAYATNSEAINPEGEAYLSHFIFGEEMKTLYRAKRGSVKGFLGPCVARWIIFDIDRTELVAALTDTKKLVSWLMQHYPETEEKLPVYFSGRKGFHVYLQLPVLEPSAHFHEVAKVFAGMAAESAGVAIDPTIYDRNRIMRLPNSRHPKSGLYKRRIDPNDFLMMGLEQILKHAAQPAGDGIPVVVGDLPNVLKDWQAADAERRKRQNERIEIGRAAPAKGGVAPRYLVDFFRFKTPNGERATTLFRCAAVLTEMGCPPHAVNALLDEPGRDNGLSPTEVKRQIQCGIDHARQQQKGESKA